MSDEIICIGCGRTEERACEGGCSWVAVDEDRRVGICSRCAKKPLDELIDHILDPELHRAAG